MRNREPDTKPEQSNEPKLAPEDAVATWMAAEADLLTVIGFTLRDMGLPIPPTGNVRPRGVRGFRVPGFSAIKVRLLTDPDLPREILHDLWFEFERGVSRRRVYRDQATGWLKRAAERLTWKKAGRRARQLLEEIEQSALFNDEGQASDAWDYLTDARNRGAEEELERVRRMRVAAGLLRKLSPYQRDLLFAKEDQDYGELAERIGKRPGTLRVAALRLCARLSAEAQAALTAEARKGRENESNDSNENERGPS